MEKQHNVNSFPSQKRSKSQKTKKWAQECVDAADNNTAHHHEGVRKSRRDKLVNINLYNGKIDRRDMEATINPANLKGSFIPDDIPHYPIAAPKIDLLVGEEYKRRFDYKVVVTNPDAISEKEEAKKNLWLEKLQEILLTEDQDEQKMQAQMEKFNKYITYEWQDIKELTATNILRHYFEEQEFKYKFNEGFKTALLTGEEIYQCDIISKEPIMVMLNPANVHTIRSGGSERIEDSDLIIIDEYWSPGRVVDTYYDKLKAKDIDYIEGGFVSRGDDTHVGNIHHQPDLWVGGWDVENYINLAETHGHQFSQYQDVNGNVRVLRVYWRSYRKVKRVKYYDEDGEEQYDYFPEDYNENKDLGEEAKIQWINEWWEGTKIGKDIYVNMRPRPIQYNKMENPSKCHPGIVGLVYNTNQHKSVSMMDRMKQYQYLYDATKDRLNKAMAKYMGPLMELDLAKVPGNWEIDKWLFYAYSTGLAVTDSFKEGNKGASTGKLAGNFNTTGKPMNLDMGNYIQQHISMLEYIKSDMSEIVGITKQREGQVSSSETVGGVERSVNQSSHITEHWFIKHDAVKARVLTVFLETAKAALRNRSKKVQYILGDDSIAALELDGNEFCESDYGILVSLNNKYQELDQAMRQLAHAGIQNDKMDFSTLMDIYTSDSISDIRRKIERKEQEKAQRDSEMFQQEQESKQMEVEAKMASEQEERALKESINVRDNEVKLQIAMLKEIQTAIAAGEDDGSGIRLDEAKHKDDIMIKMKQLQQQMEMHKDKMEKEDKKIAVSRQKSTSNNK
jgi:hypothetical protein